MSTNGAPRTGRGRGSPPTRSPMTPAGGANSGSEGSSKSGSPPPPSQSQIPGTGRGRPILKPSRPLSSSSSDESLAAKMNDLKVVDLAKRPGFGTAGQKAQIAANFFELRLTREVNVTQYHVDITHSTAKFTRDEKRLAFFQCVDKYPTVFKNRHALGFDGDHLCVSLDGLHAPGQEQEGAFTLGVQIRLPRFEREETLDLRFQLVGLVHMSPKNVSAASQNERYTTPMHVFDVLIRMARSATTGDMCRFWYPFKSTVFRMPDQGYGAHLGCGLAIIQGLFGASRIGQDYIPYINFDVSHSGFYKPQPVIDFMLEILNENFSRRRGVPEFSAHDLNATTTLKPNWLQTINKELKGLKVVMHVRRANGEEMDREFRVNSVSTETALTKSFEIKARDEPGRKITVATYFIEKYGGIRLPKLNLLHVGSQKKDTYLPMEYCRVAPNQRVPRKLTSDQLSVMIKATAISAPNRRDKILELVKECKFGEDPYLKAFGMQINPQMKVVNNARLLPAPAIQYGGGPRAIVNPRDGSWDIRNQKFSVAASCDSVGALIIDEVRGSEEEAFYSGFFSFLLRTCCEYGMRLPQGIEGRNIRVVLPNNDMTQVQPALASLVQSGIKFIIVVVPQKGSIYYSEVKKSAEINLGVMTQCVCKPTVAKTMNKHDRMTTTNIALKINTKLGGINSTAQADAMAKKVLFEEPTLVLGIDVTHPAAGESRVPSIASVVGNLDDSFMRYAASIRVQKHRREAMVHLQAPIKERLIEYFSSVQKANQAGGQAAKSTKPQRLVIFRDGVAEGQFQEVMREELAEIRLACKSMDENYKPKITLIVAQKRHHARFFPTSQQTSCGKAMNVRPGTVVDTDITHPDQFEYYLCSHFGIQGTSRPIRYHVLLDENGYTADQLQMVTYYMCHLYARCTRTVSVPAPIYYADLACRRARVHLYDKIQDFSSDTMSTRSGTNGETSGQSMASEEEFTKSTTLAEGLKMRMYFS